ncbi:MULTISPECIES: hypothetical protein [Phytobacter]|uniref:Uncharacterized protein n=1 Tax=Phytobacter diazotrophicus TaxID=395631 RepID=A0ABM7VTN3_9ENTR|nr:MULTISPECIES: hypothetical protein [Phytobacter]MDU4153664.1 hypothetical protein [Enterobacteriaceae bacterium]MDU7381491.1 hypothetical protein [Enterobacteriaceae bacterium]BBE77004.1 hypothetical protein MRY16398_20600 [Phytobacter sp. MRY16-398]BDD50469.1 hypothetical protein PDTA9734_19560 [Phytobacter diazotrophicus]BEG81498.1 hypothetical protein PDTA9730_19540 [Phytobacter diazotrophicus]
MFEQMKNNVTRVPGNLTKLNQYQKDIDQVSKLFPEKELLDLMTITKPDQTLQMKPAVNCLHVISPAASMANQINLFQHPSLLQKWLEMECSEFAQLAIFFYAQQSRKNVIPEKIRMQMASFIENELASAVNGDSNLKLLADFINTLEEMCHSLTFIDFVDTEHAGQEVIRDFRKKTDEYTNKITKFLTSEYWLEKLPKDINIPATNLSWLVFCYFCSEYLFVFIQATLNRMKDEKIIQNDYLHHPKMIILIILSMLPYEVVHKMESLRKCKNTLISPDEFVIKTLCIKGKQNTTGYKKDVEQLLRKTYIYIALLLNPEWVPSAKELISFLSGESTEISGLMHFQSTSSGLGVQINNITLLNKEEYFEKIVGKVTEQ